MLIAAVDTASLTLSVALAELRDGALRLVAEHAERAQAKPGPQGPTGGHGGRLPGALLELLAAHGLSLDDVKGWAAGLGPGSFTGLRIGLATWKGLAYARRQPLAGASSLAALALAAAPSAPEGALLVPLLDARKAEVYAGFYRVRGGAVEAFAPEAVLPAERLLAQLEALTPGGAVLGFGEGYAAWKATLAPHLAELAGAPETPPAAAIARLTAPSLASAAFDAQAVFALEPHYVRASEAELKFPGGTVPPPRA